MISVIFFLGVIVLLIFGGYSLRKNREKLNNEHLLFKVGGDMVMCTFQEAKDFHDMELLRRAVVKNKSAYKKMKPRKWRIGSWTR